MILTKFYENTELRLKLNLQFKKIIDYIAEHCRILPTFKYVTFHVQNL